MFDYSPEQLLILHPAPMDYSLSLPVTYRGTAHEFPLEIIPGREYSRFAVLIDDVPVVYERDDSGDFRAIIPNLEEIEAKLPDRDLLEAIGAVIEELAR